MAENAFPDGDSKQKPDSMPDVAPTMPMKDVLFSYALKLSMADSEMSDVTEPKLKQIHDLPREIIVQCFGELAPRDLKNTVLVSTEWRDWGEDPCLWSWCGIQIRKKEDLRKLSARRFSNVRKIKIGPAAHLDWGDWEALFQAIEEFTKLKEISVDSQNMRTVEDGLFARRLSKLEKVSLFDTQMRAEQIISLLTHIAQEDSKLRKLVLNNPGLDLLSGKHVFGRIPPPDLAKGVIRLEEVDLDKTGLSAEQINCILVSIAQDDTTLKKLDLRCKDLSRVEPEVLARAMIKLEDVNLCKTSLSADQIASILRSIVQKDTKLKKLDICYNSNLSNVPPEILSGAFGRLEEFCLSSYMLTTAQVRTVLTVVTQKDIKPRKYCPNNPKCSLL